MGKRSTFPRRKHDAYDTPCEAVRPLVTHLPRVFGFSEPCAGNGALIRGICALHDGAHCVESFDLEPRHLCIQSRDALADDWTPSEKAEFIITNPPWTREILHPMIEKFAALKPTWLLFDADWMHTRQAVPYMRLCRKIVSVGRVKWIRNSEHTGKDNAAWYLFDGTQSNITEFVGRAAA